MINIKNYIKESIFDNPEEIGKKDITVKPKDTDELRQIIYNKVKKYKPGETVDLNFIDTSKITNFTYLFYFSNAEIYNFNVSEWDVSNAINMQSMFKGCTIFNCDLSNWDVSKVGDMRDMFFDCKKLNCDLSKWKVHEWCYTSCMFSGCASIKNIPLWYKKSLW